MFLCRRRPDLILIMSKFNLPNLKNLKCVFGQAFITNNPLFDIKICCLQNKRTIFFLPMKFFLSSPPSSLLLLDYSKAMAFHFSSMPSPHVQNIFTSHLKQLNDSLILITNPNKYKLPLYMP
jgi:hypothetical protein